MKAAAKQPIAALRYAPGRKDVKMMARPAVIPMLPHRAPSCLDKVRVVTVKVCTRFGPFATFAITAQPAAHSAFDTSKPSAMVHGSKVPAAMKHTKTP